MTEDGVARDGIKGGDVVVVTGGGGGFGRAFSRRFARGGARVAVWDIDSKAGEDIVREIGAEGGEASLAGMGAVRPALASVARSQEVGPPSLDRPRSHALVTPVALAILSS